VVDRLRAPDRGLEVFDCCCTRIPQVIEGRPVPLGNDRMMVVPEALWYRQQACGPMFGRT
jgi:hypothetical protein